jgi:hypothetical protein
MASMLTHVPRLPLSLDPLIAEAKRRMRRRRVWIAASLILIGGIAAAVASMATSGGPGSTGGGPGVHGLLFQVRSSFGDGRLLSASVSGRTLTVEVAAPTEPSSVGATFEAQMLAAALHDAQAAAGQTPINSVRFVGLHGKAIPGYGPAPVGTDTSGHPLPRIPALAKGACNAAAQGIQTSSLVIESAPTLPYAGGACAFRFRTPDPSSFAAGIEVAKLVNAIGDPNERSYLVEVDNEAGVPQFVHDYTPGGGGVAYVRPGSGILFGP